MRWISLSLLLLSFWVYSKPDPEINAKQTSTKPVTKAKSDSSEEDFDFDTMFAKDKVAKDPSVELDVSEFKKDSDSEYSNVESDFYYKYEYVPPNQNTSSENYISVEFEGVCGLIPCSESNLKIWGGAGDFIPSFDKARSGAIHKGVNGINGTYHWQATLDDKYVCSGTFTISEHKPWLNLFAYSKCTSTYYNYF